MGTYTTNYNLFMPTVGEQGWGELVNGNFSTIDTTMKSLNNKIEILEPLSIIHVDENQNVTFPGNVIATNINENGVIGWLLMKFSTVQPSYYAESFQISGSVTGTSSGRTGTVTTTFKIPSFVQVADSTGEFTFTIDPAYSQGGSATFTVTNLINGMVYDTFTISQAGADIKTETRVLPLYSSIYISTSTHVAVSVTGKQTYLVPANY